MIKRRVAITGLGAVTPLGNTRDEFWRRLLAGESGIAEVTAFDTREANLTTHFAGEVKNFDPDTFIGKREARRMDRFAQFAFVAAREAIEDAQLPEDPAFRERCGTIVGSGIGGIITMEEMANRVKTDFSKVSPFFIPMLMGNAAPAHISMRYGLRGPLFTASSACASANDAIGTAYNAVASGDVLAMVAGGAEATVTKLAMGGFCSMRALSTRNDDPTRASRPFDKGRDGFVLAEGGAMMVLEELEYAQARGVRIYAEVVGAGQSADAYNLVAVDPTGQGVTLALRRALASANMQPSEVDYVNAHGTSTPIGDPAESKGIEAVFGDHARKLAVSSTKSMHGHALGAAGAIEGVATTLTIYHDIIPPTINYENPDPECTLDYVPNVARKQTVNVALSNSFGFGGHNSVLVFRKYQP